MTATPTDDLISRAIATLKTIAALHEAECGMLQPPVGNVGGANAGAILGLAYTHQAKTMTLSAHRRRNLERTGLRILVAATELESVLSALFPGTDLCWSVIPPDGDRKHARCLLGLGHARRVSPDAGYALGNFPQLEIPDGRTTTLIQTSAPRWKSALRRLARLPWGSANGDRMLFALTYTPASTVHETDIPARQFFLCAADNLAHATTLGALFNGAGAGAEAMPNLDRPPRMVARLVRDDAPMADIRRRAAEARRFGRINTPPSAAIVQRTSDLLRCAADLVGHTALRVTYDLQADALAQTDVSVDPFAAREDRSDARAARDAVVEAVCRYGAALRADIADALPERLDIHLEMVAHAATGTTPTAMRPRLRLDIEQISLPFVLDGEIRNACARLAALRQAGNPARDADLHMVAPLSPLRGDCDPTATPLHDTLMARFCRATHPAQALVMASFSPDCADDIRQGSQNAYRNAPQYVVARAEPLPRSGISTTFSQLEERVVAG